MVRRVLASTAVLVFTACVPRIALRPLGQDEVVEGRGYTFRPPAGPWYAPPERGSAWPMVARTPVFPAASLHTVLALSGVLDGAAPGAEGLWSALRGWIGEYGDPRFTLASERWAPRPQGAVDCIGFDVTFLDRGVPGREGEAFTLRNHGVACRHPVARDRAVVLTGSERIPPGEAPIAGLDGELEPFLSSLAFGGPRPAAISGGRVGASPVAATVAYGALWAVGRPGRLVALDLQTARTRKELTVGKSPFFALAAGGSLWVLDGTEVTTLHRVDPESGAILATLPLPGAIWLAAGRDAVFASGDQGLHRIPLSSGAPTLLRPGRLGGLRVRDDVVWVVDRAGGRVLTVDAASGSERGEPIAVGEGPTHLVEVEGGVFALLAGASRAAVRIDEGRRATSLRIPLDSVPWGACALGDVLWITLPGEGAVRAYAAATGRPVDAIPVRGSRMVCDGGAIWMGGPGQLVARLVP